MSFYAFILQLSAISSITYIAFDKFNLPLREREREREREMEREREREEELNPMI